MVQKERWSRVSAEMSVHAPGVHPPIHLETVRRQTGVQSIAHITVFRLQVCITNRSEAVDIQMSVPAEQGVICPGDTVYSLVPDQLPLGTLKSETDTFPGPIRVNSKDMRVVL